MILVNWKLPEQVKEFKYSCCRITSMEVNEDLEENLTRWKG
jgi:hypothetical protein